MRRCIGVFFRIGYILLLLLFLLFLSFFRWVYLYYIPVNVEFVYEAMYGIFFRTGYILLFLLFLLYYFINTVSLSSLEGRGSLYSIDVETRTMKFGTHVRLDPYMYQ